MMTRNKYLKELRSFLGKLPKEDRKRILEFYNELIDDKLEAGQSEEEILGKFGSPEELAKQIFQDNGQTYSPPNTTSRIMRISAIVLGSPIWLSLLAVFLVLVFALFLVLWAAVVSFWCCVFAFGIAGIGGAAGSILMLFFTGQPAAAFFQLGISLAAGGLGLLTGMGMRKLTLLCAQFTKKSCVGLFHFFLGKKAEINV